MKRRTFIAGLGSAATWPVVAWAQEPTGRQEEIIMRKRFSGLMVTVAIAAAAVSAAILVPVTRTSAQAPAASAAALKTPWGEPDLQGIWTDEFDTPFQRPAIGCPRSSHTVSMPWPAAS